MVTQSILFVTAYKDIGRSNWTNYNRDNSEYFNCFLKLANNIEYTLIVFFDDDVMEYLTTQYTFKSNIIFKKLNDVDTFLDKYLDQDLTIMTSDEYKNKIPSERKCNPEHCYSAYNLINHSKINFVSECKKIYPEYEFYSWIDFGYVRDEKSIPRIINISTLPNKIIYHCLLYPTHKIDPNVMLRSDDIYLTGSSYIIHSSQVLLFEQLYENKIKEFHEKCITDDDQNLILQLYYDYPDMFHLIQNNNWFSLFNILPF